ncbi:MAG TPA: nuclear transport factor 2 family protein [Rhizomicrobium sp.]|jgi:ketosteroid isomerase-like protein
MAATPQACMDAFIAAMIRRDMAAALDLLTGDVALFYSNGTALWGKEQFTAVMTANWKLVQDYKYTTVEAIWLAQSDTAAAAIYTFSWSGLAGGNAVSGGGRGTRVFRKEGSDWRIAHEHLSAGQWKPETSD